MMRKLILSALLLSLCRSIGSFSVAFRGFSRAILPLCMRKDGESWPGTRPPINNMRLLEQRMDASWGRAKYRTEVWEDNMNPMNDWWLAYEPSKEQTEAAAAGYDFSNPKEWFEAKGIDYEKALAETEALEKKLFDQYLKDKEEREKNFSPESWAEFQENFFEMQRLAFERSFRALDDTRQAEKGQPSLDDEDTGTQWKNDPI